MIKAIANSSVVNATHSQVTDSRFQRFYNSGMTVANIEIGSNSTAVDTTIILGPGKELTVDLGDISSKWISLNTLVSSVYRTPVAGGSA